MKSPLGDPVGSIEGIGPARTAALKEIGVVSVFDLLHTPSDELHRAVSATASYAEVRSWQFMAQILTIDGVTPQWSEALVRAGQFTLSHIREESLSGLQALFASAKDNHIIPDVPSSDQLMEMKLEAAELMWSGCLAGKVINLDGNPVSQAEVRIGWIDDHTDDRGLFFLKKIPLDTQAPLIIQALSGSLIAESPSLVRGTEAVGIEEFQLSASLDTGAQTLSEYDGDLLPNFAGANIKRETDESNVLREVDALVVLKFMQREPKVDLTSYFRNYRPGELIVSVFRIPADKLPADAKVGDQFLVKGGQLIPAKWNPWQLELQRKHRRRLKFLKNQPEPTSPDEIDQLFAAFKEMK